MTKSTIDRLTSLGDQVIGKASEKASQNPTANRVMQSAMQMKERVDDLSKRVRGLEATEKQIAELEKRVAKLEGAREARAQIERAGQIEHTGKTGYDRVGTRTRRAPGTSSNAAGVVPTCSPSTSIGRCSAASTSTRVLRSTSTLGWLTCLPL